MYSMLWRYSSTQSRFYKHHTDWRTNFIHLSGTKKKNSVGGASTRSVMWPKVICYIQSQGMYWLSYWLIRWEKRSYWKSQLQTALCGWSRNELALWLQTWQKGTCRCSFRTRPAAGRSIHKHSQTWTTASTTVSLVIKRLEACWCEKLIWY